MMEWIVPLNNSYDVGTTAMLLLLPFLFLNVFAPSWLCVQNSFKMIPRSRAVDFEMKALYDLATLIRSADAR